MTSHDGQFWGWGIIVELHHTGLTLKSLMDVLVVENFDLTYAK